MIFDCCTCKRSVAGDEFESRTWQCRSCAGPAWWITVKRAAQMAGALLLLGLIGGVLGIALFAPTAPVWLSFVIGFVASYVFLAGLIWYLDREEEQRWRR